MVFAYSDVNIVVAARQRASGLGVAAAWRMCQSGGAGGADMAENVNSIAPPLPVPPLHRSAAFAPALIASLLGYLSFSLILPYALSESPPGVGVLLLIGTIALSAMAIVTTVMIRRASYRIVQEDRDRFAREVHAVVRSGGTPPPFSIYLRPFFTDGELTTNEGFYRSIPMTPAEIADIGQRRDVERAAAHALEEHAPLVTLGRPEPRLGAGRIATTDEDWFADFQALVRHASRIVIVPIGQPGTLVEIRNIALDPALLAKTVFVRPASRKRRHFRFGPEGNLKSIRQMWDWTREQLRDVLPAFPKFRGGTRLLAFPPGQGPVEYWGDGFASVQQRSGIRQFLVDGRTDTARLWLLALLLPALSFAWMGYIRWDVWNALGERPYGTPSIDSSEILAGFAFIQLMTGIMMALIGLRSLVTGDIPWRVMRVVIISIIAVFLSGYLHSILMESEEPHIGWWEASYFVMSSSFKFLLLFTLCVISGKSMNYRYILLWLSFGPLLILLSFIVGRSGILAEESESIFRHASAFTALFAITIAPSLSRSLPLWKMAATAAIAAALVGVALADPWAILGFLSEPDRCTSLNPQCELTRETGRLWRRFGTALLGVLPILAFPFVIRRWPGVGLEKRWAAPLDRYPE